MRYFQILEKFEEEKIILLIYIPEIFFHGAFKYSIREYTQTKSNQRITIPNTYIWLRAIVPTIG